MAFCGNALPYASLLDFVVLEPLGDSSIFLPSLARFYLGRDKAPLVQFRLNSTHSP
jgi:hypothetical protein